jgi:hypothetical protein
MKLQNPNMNPVRLKNYTNQLFDAADLNGDGVIDAQEYAMAYNKFN